MTVYGFDQAFQSARCRARLQTGPRGPGATSHSVLNWTRRAGPHRLAPMMNLAPTPIRSRAARLARGLRQWKRAPEILACAAQIAEWRRRFDLLGRPALKLSVHDPLPQRRPDTRPDLSRPRHCLGDLLSDGVPSGWRLQDDRRCGSQHRNVRTLRRPKGSGRQHSRFGTLSVDSGPTTQRPFDSNGLEQRVTVHPIGLSGEDSTRFMADVGPSQSRGTTTESTGVPVATKTLAHFLDSAGLADADLLKMDIEGGEHEVFSEAGEETLQRFRRIALEYHPGGSSRALFAKLQRAGFACHHDARSSDDSGVAHFVREE